MEVIALIASIVSLLAGILSLFVSYLDYKKKKAQRSDKRRP